jgi:hypothetical protein
VFFERGDQFGIKACRSGQCIEKDLGILSIQGHPLLFPNGFFRPFQSTDQDKMTDGLALKSGGALYKILCAAVHPEVDPLAFVVYSLIHDKIPFFSDDLFERLAAFDFLKAQNR